MIHKVLAFILGLWIVQGLLSYVQINNYRKTLSSIKEKGRVYIGQEKGKFKPGTILFIVVDDSDIIVDFLEMKGITVFERFRTREMYIGKSVKGLLQEISSVQKKNVTMKAIEKALGDFSLT